MTRVRGCCTTGASAGARVSKERQRRREAREREAGIVAAARAAEAEKRERRGARKRALTSRFPRRRHSRQTGVLAQRRRKQTGATIALLLGLNVLVWVLFTEWPARAMALILTLLVAPVLHTLLFRRR